MNNFVIQDIDKRPPDAIERLSYMLGFFIGISETEGRARFFL